jgi:hypothetical protein
MMMPVIVVVVVVFVDWTLNLIQQVKDQEEDLVEDQL